MTKKKISKKVTKPIKKVQKLPEKQLTASRTNKIAFLCFLLIFGAVGSYMLIRSQAATGLKPQMSGVIDRQGQPKTSNYYPNPVNGFVAKNNNANKTDITWAELQPTRGGEIAANNAIDQAIASVKGSDVRIKLRIYAGYGAPEWAKNLPVTEGQPGPFETCDSDGTALNCGTLGHIWELNYRNAYKDFMAKLAAKYDNVVEISEVAITGCSTAFGEPLLRQASNPDNIAKYIAAGYNEAKNKDCERDQFVAHQAWTTTRSAIALNPYQEFDAGAKKFRANENFTEELMEYCRSTLGKRCVLGNNSIGKHETTYTCADISNTATWQANRDEYGRMYTKMRCLGAPIYFQTATAEKIARSGSTLGSVLTWAAAQGASMVELPTGYNNPSGPNAKAVYLSPSDLAQYEKALTGNITTRRRKQ